MSADLSLVTDEELIHELDRRSDAMVVVLYKYGVPRDEDMPLLIYVPCNNLHGLMLLSKANQAIVARMSEG